MEDRFEKKLERTYRICKLACQKKDIAKADPIWGDDLQELDSQQLSQAIWLCSTGVRRASAIKTKKLWRGRGGVVNTFISDFKFLDNGEHKVVQCHCTCLEMKDGTKDDEFCLQCNEELYEELQGCFPIKEKAYDKIVKALDVQGHSFRRTLALFLRIRAEKDGLQINDFFQRINKAFKWARFSSQVVNYSQDWEGYKDWEFPPFLEPIYRRLKEQTEEQLVKSLEKLQKKCKKYTQEEAKERANEEFRNYRINQYIKGLSKMNRKVLG